MSGITLINIIQFQFTLFSSGRIYQTHSSRGIQQSTAYLQDTGGDARATLRRSLNSKTATIPPSSYRQSFANYQNCTLVQSHLPHSSYGTYVSLAPKILIFPVFVQVEDQGFIPTVSNYYLGHYAWNEIISV